MTPHEIEIAFSQAMAVAGLGDTLIPADGKLHRFKVPADKGRQLTGWAVLHGDGLPAGVAGDWRTGERFTWKGTGEAAKLSKADRREVEALRRKREAALEDTQQRAATKAAALYERLPAASADHPYLARKKIPAGLCKVTTGGALVVSVHDVRSNEIISLQFIRSDGEKRFLTGGRTAGGCCILGNVDEDHVVIAEGYATGWSIHAATDWPVVVAFNAGNLRSVAQALREKHPDRKMIIAADNDTETPGNPGVTKATEAAKAIGARLVVPLGPGDFNDLYVARGADAVKAMFMTDSPSFIKRDIKGIRAAKKESAEKAEAERRKAEADRLKEERQRATDEKVRLAKEAAEDLAQYRGLDLEVRVKAKAKELDIGKDVLRKEVALLQDGYKAADAIVTMPEVEPWPEEVDGDALLDELIETFRGCTAKSSTRTFSDMCVASRTASGPGPLVKYKPTSPRT